MKNMFSALLVSCGFLAACGSTSGPAPVPAADQISAAADTYNALLAAHGAYTNGPAGVYWEAHPQIHDLY